ncbi:hypothetical protein MPH_00218 [Macrophomina phaseolina MS6]|uniref:Rhodopsin domain-containing protein n=1 Tax=Macrophomina phaseolina (strain MS6) TaxID=1126212 RepID=K2S6D6_MACPH|nr:hypothetical protein MPH_00218 [Macrophomina phaseolina MS6]
MSQWSGPAVATENRTGAIFAGNFIPQIFASAFVIARIISKACIRRKWGADDTVLCIAWAASLVLTALSCVQTDYGAGIHIDELPDSAIETNSKLDYASLLFYTLSLSLTKISICLFYLDIFADPLNRLLTKIAFAFIILYTVPLELVAMFQCNPVSAFWDPNIEARCLDMYAHFIVSATCNMLVDAFLVILVIPNILPLQIPKRQKIILLFVVSLGWLVIVASIFRICRMEAVSDPRDFTWTDYDVTIWSAVEVDVGLICVAAPATKPLFKKMAPEFLRSFTDRLSHPSDKHAPGTMARQPAGMSLPLHSRENVAETMTIASLSRNWDMGGLLRTMSRGSDAGRRASAVGLGNIVKSVDVSVETSDLERGSEAAHEVGSYRSSWGSNWKTQA